MDVATGALGTLLPKLAELLHGEYKLQKGVRKNIDFLERELWSMHAALRVVGEVPPEQLTGQVKLWAQDVRELSYRMEDVVDTFLVHVQVPDRTSKRSAKRFIKEMHTIVTASTARHQIAEEIEDIKEHVKEVAERRDRYMVDAITPARTAIDPRIKSLYTMETDLVGIDEARDELITLLTKGKDISAQQQRIVSIVGFGGLGKTTLARAVYEKLRVHFDVSVFVSISQNPYMEKLYMDMLYQLDKVKYENIHSARHDEKLLTNLVREYLLDKRYFIVIDDIWEISSWKSIRIALPENNLGSKIIITTRKRHVAEQVGYSYKIKPLPLESCRQLFCRRTFGPEGMCPDDELSEVSDRILTKCGGVPLAIITIASLLSSKKRDKMQWYDVCDSMGSGLLCESVDVRDMRMILSLSYYDLPSHLRTCLLYLSVYPEGHLINKSKLIWNWIAQGFVCQEKGVGLFELGERYFCELIDRGMILPVEMEGSGLVYGCRVHNMVLDLIRHLSSNENFVSLLDQVHGKSAASTIRRLALQNLNEEHSLGSNMHLEHLRSLDAIGCPMYVIPPLSSFRVLRVLDLQSCGSVEGYHLRHIGKLLFLKFLGLRNTVTNELPEEIGHLMFLQTVDLEGSGVKELPASMGQLTQLMCLNVDWKTRVPHWIGNLTSLQQLEIYPGGGHDDDSASWFVKELRKLTELRVLCSVIKIKEEQTRDLLESLAKLQKIEVIHFDDYGEQLVSGVVWEPEGFVLSPHLRFLELRRLEFSRLPEWINPSRLYKLCHLWLMLSDMDDKDLEILGRFPVLRCLHMVIVNSERGEIITSGGGGAFQNLKFCSITRPLKFPEGAMPKLEILDFRFNVRLLRDAKHDFDFDFGLRNLSSLQQVTVQSNCQAASPQQVEEAERALKNAVDIHPNCPSLEFRRFGHVMRTTDAETRTMTQQLESGNDGAPAEQPELETATKIEEIKNQQPEDAERFQSLLHGVNEPRDELIKSLSMADGDASNKMKIQSIVRSEGLGKTTLAQEVFDKLRPQFDCGVFVQVGQNPDLRKVFTDILIGLDKQTYTNFPLTIMELIRLLRKSLLNRRFFIVVDDIWDSKVWDLIQCALVENSNGSAVLTTSRDKVITEIIAGKQRPLAADECKQIFCQTLFGSPKKCPPELEDVLGKLIDTCDGIREVVIDTVELLASIPLTVKDWQAVYDRRVFALSYSKLPEHLKKCLLYLSLFQKGYEIRGERLVWGWIAEGFVKETPGQTSLQEVAGSYLSEFIKKRMIEAVEVDAGCQAISCRAYDFVHDFIILKSTEEKFAATLDGSQSRSALDTIHRWSIKGNNLVVKSLTKGLLSQVRSLIVSGDTVPPLSFFPKLLVLDLGACDSLKDDHLKGIRNSESLIYLVIGGKCITGIPKEIGSLKLLKTLDLSASDLHALPVCVFQLKQLERLWVNSHMKIPAGIRKMISLQEVGDINIIKPELLKEIRDLPKLRVLGIAIWSWDQSVKGSVKQLRDNLRSLVQFNKNIQSLSILTCCSLDFVDENLGDEWASASLQKLEIRYSCFHTWPTWIDSHQNLSSLSIEVYKLTRHILHALGKLPTLHSLSLASKHVPQEMFGNDPDGFKNLISLKFASNAMNQMFAPKPATIEGAEPAGMKKLKRLTFMFQASRTQEINQGFSFGLENLCSLEHIRVEIICLAASRQVVENAEAAIRRAISSDQSRRPHLEIRRVQEETMVEEVDTEQESSPVRRGLPRATSQGSNSSQPMEPAGHTVSPVRETDAEVDAPRQQESTGAAADPSHTTSSSQPDQVDPAVFKDVERNIRVREMEFETIAQLQRSQLVTEQQILTLISTMQFLVRHIISQQASALAAAPAVAPPVVFPQQPSILLTQTTPLTTAAGASTSSQGALHSGAASLQFSRGPLYPPFTNSTFSPTDLLTYQPNAAPQPSLATAGVQTSIALATSVALPVPSPIPAQPLSFDDVSLVPAASHSSQQTQQAGLSTSAMELVASSPTSPKVPAETSGVLSSSALSATTQTATSHVVQSGDDVVEQQQRAAQRTQ